MTGYDKKTITISTNVNTNITLQIDVNLNGWHDYKIIQSIVGKLFEHVFPDGYTAHWIHAVIHQACTATISLKYE